MVIAIHRPTRHEQEFRGAIQIERTRDMDLATSIITDPGIYHSVTDDGSPARKDFRAVDSDALYYLVAREGADVLGLWMFVPENLVTWDVHTCLLPRALRVRGRSVAAARACAEWVWQNTQCRRIITHVPAYNRLALHFAQKAGMIKWGTNEKSFLKNGVLHDQILLGMSRPNWSSER